MNFLAIILIILSGIFILFYYKSTNPPIHTKLKIFLGVLRFLFFALVILLIFNPSLHFSRSKKVPPHTIILIDSSASMAQPLNDNQIKSQSSKRWMDAISEYFNKQNINFEDITFSNGLQKDSTTTDIFLALKELNDSKQDDNITDVILISDGLQHNNTTYTYLENIDFPVFPVILGQEVELHDVVLNDVQVNNPLFLNTETEIACKISGIPEESLFQLSIKDKDNRLIAEKQFMGSENRRDFTVTFTPYELGYQKLVAQVTLQDKEEYSTDNNRKEFLVNVVKNKALFTLISSSLNWDITFINRALLKNDRFQTTLIEQRKDGYYSDNRQVKLPEKINETDILILHNSDNFNFQRETIKAIERFVARGGNVLYLGKIDSELSKLLPLKSTRYNEVVQTTILPTSLMENYQTFMINSDESLTSFWRSLPPITTYFYDSKPQTEIIAQADIISTNPVIAFSFYSKGNVLQFSGYDFYRWKMWEKSNNPWFDNFILNVGQWLLNTDISKRFICLPDKMDYMEGETVEFSAQLYDEKMNIVHAQDIKLIIAKDDSIYIEKFLHEEDNAYTTEILDLQPGKYSYYAETSLGKYKYNDEGEFLIEERTLEQSSHGIQTAYLEYIASKTGGRIIAEENALASNLDDVPREYQKISIVKEIELWRKWYVPILALLLIITELFIRKKKGLL